MTFPLFHCSLHSRPHHAVSVQCCCSDTQRHVRSHFDSKALHFRIRPYCHKRGLRVSGGECGPVCAMWHPFGLPSPIRGGQMLADHSRKTVHALSRAIWERKARTMPTKKVGNVPGLFACSGISMPGSFFAKKAVSTTRQSSPNFINANKKKTRERAQNLRTTVFLYWIKYWLKTLVPVQPPPRVGTATAASRYNHRRL